MGNVDGFDTRYNQVPGTWFLVMHVVETITIPDYEYGRTWYTILTRLTVWNPDALNKTSLQ